MSLPPHLRLVPNDDGPTDDTSGDATSATPRPKIEAKVTPADWQFDLPFEGQALGVSVVIASLEAMTGPKLRDLLAHSRPDSVVDLREMIRFDLPGTNREDMFRTFRRLHTHYLKDPLPWHSISVKELVASDYPVSNLLFHELSERQRNRVMVFVTRPADCRFIAAHLRRIMPERLSVPFQIEEAS